MSVVNQIEFNIDMVPIGERPVVHVSEGDVGRTYKVNLFYNSVSFTPTNVSTVTITGLYENDNAPSPATGSWSSGNSYVTFTLPADFCKISGQLLCEIRLKDTSDNDIGSGNFILMVERGYSENAAIVDYPTVSETINEAVSTATAAATSASGSATAAASSAAAAASSAAAAAVSEQNAFSGTPDGYAALVNTVNRNSLITHASLSLNTSVNTTITTGLWYCGQWADTPANVAKSGYLAVIEAFADSVGAYVKQLYSPYADSEIWFRTRNAGTWADWKKLPTRAEVDKLNTNMPISGSTSSNSTLTITFHGSQSDQVFCCLVFIANRGLYLSVRSGTDSYDSKIEIGATGLTVTFGRNENDKTITITSFGGNYRGFTIYPAFTRGLGWEYAFS